MRGEVGASLEMDASTHYAPYGTPFDAQSTSGFEEVPFGFTGEHTDPTGQVHLRARQYDPALGVFTARDPFAGMHDTPMSLNGYSYVHGNPIMHTDPSGRIAIGAIAGAALGGLIGGAFGWAFGHLIGEGLWYRVNRGDCGCRRQRQLENTTRQEFVRTTRRVSAIMGALLGALAGSGPLGMIISGFFGVALSGQGLIQAVQDMRENGVTVCNLAELILSLVGLIGAGTLFYRGAGRVRSPRIDINVNPSPRLIPAPAGGSLRPQPTTPGGISIDIGWNPPLYGPLSPVYSAPIGGISGTGTTTGVFELVEIPGDGGDGGKDDDDNSLEESNVEENWRDNPGIQPPFVRDAPTFLSWMQRLHDAFRNEGFVPSSSQMRNIMNKAIEYGVRVEHNEGHGPAQAPWTVPHLHFGDTRAHVPLPEAFPIRSDYGTHVFFK